MTKSKHENVFIIYDNKTKALISISDDECHHNQTLKKLITNDIMNEKTDLEIKILNTDDKETAQEYERMIIQLEQQENKNDLRSYILGDKVICRYLIYIKQLNDTDTKNKIFFP